MEELSLINLCFRVFVFAISTQKVHSRMGLNGSTFKTCTCLYDFSLLC